MKNYKGDNMKKLLILSTLTLCTLGGLINININHDNDLKESTIDYFNEKSGIKKLTIQEIDNKQSTFNASKIYVQTGNDNEGNEYLRFATALRGNFSNVKYTRTMVGKDDRSAIVETVYKGISSTNNGETISSYSNGESLFNYDITSTKDYYWACYTIKYTAESTFKDTDITINLNVDDKYYDTRTISLNDAKNINNINFGDLIIDNKINVTEFNSILKTTTTGYIQGLATDGNNLYYSLSDRNKIASLRRYNPITKEDVELIKNIKMSDSISDGGYLKYIDNKLYLVSNTGDILVYDISNNKMLDNLTFNGLTDKIIDFSYNQKRKEYIVYTSGKISFFDQNKNALTGGFDKINAKRIQVDDNYIYAITNRNDTREIYVTIYDYNGNNLASYTFKNDNILANVDKNFNVSNILFLNNKLYVSALSWTSNCSGLYEVTLEDISDTTTKDELTWLDYYNHSKIDNVELKYSFTDTNMFNFKLGTNIQGACTDYEGKYAYFAFNDSSNNTGVIGKYDLKSKKLIGYSQKYTVCSTGEWTSDNANIFYHEGKVYVIGTNGDFSSIEVDKITYSNSAEVISNDETIKFENVTGAITSVAYSKKENKFAVATSDKLYIISGDMQTIISEKSCSNIQTLYTNGTNLFCLVGEGKYGDATLRYNYATIREYSWTGDLYKTMQIGSKDNSIGGTYVYESNNARNIQNIVEINGDLYFSTLTYYNVENMSTGPALYRMDIENKTDIASKSNITLGEYVEINKNSKKENVFDGYRNTKITYHGYLQGVVTHGDYVYYSYTKDPTNKATTIVRSNPTNNEWKKGASTINLGRDSLSDNEDAGRILFYNDQLWVVKYNSKELIGVDKDTLVANGETLPFDNLGTNINIKDAKFNEFNNMFIIYGTDNYIYYFDTNRNLIEKTKMNVTGTTIHVDDNYIYVANKTTAKKYLTTSIYSYSGEKISSLNIGSDKIGDTTGTLKENGYNIQAFTEYKGMLILVGLGWTSPMNGGQIYYLNKK